MKKPVTIIGAGIAGLAAALSLSRHGIAVRVLERAPGPSEIGAGLQVSPNGYRVMHALGLASALDEASLVNNAVVLADGRTGAPVLRMPLVGAFRLVPRPALISVLTDAARAAGIEVTYGRMLERLPKEGVILGADGLHSIVRPWLNGPDAPFFTGQVAWRAVVSGHRPAEARVDMDAGRHLVRYPLPDGRVNLVGIEERNEWTDEGWRREGSPDQFRATFADLPDATDDLAKVEVCHVWGLFRHPVARRWQDGRVAIIGDAAHPTLPFLAQGANLALEDAWSFAEAFAAGKLPEWEGQRRVRVEKAIRAANANARNYHLSGPRRLVAHAGLRALGRIAPGFMPSRFAWLYDHDVTAGRSVTPKPAPR